MKRLPRGLPAALLLTWAAAFAAWTPSLSGAFLKDDLSNFIENPVASAPSSWPSYFYRRAAISAEHPLTNVYRPLASVSYAATGLAAGFNPFFFHLADLAGHAANAALVLLIGLELCGSLPAAAAGAALFALHPAQAESVSYISGARPSVFALLFCLLALRSHDQGRRGKALALFICASLFKENALGFPLALAVWDWTGAGRPKPLETARRTAPYFAAAFALAILRKAVLGETTDSGLYGGTLASHAAYALAGLATHVRSALWPYGQRQCYTYPSAGEPAFLVAGVLLFAFLSAALVYGLARRRPWVRALAWAAALLLPVSNLIPIATLAADRYLYPSFAGLAWLTALGLARLRGRGAWLAAAALAAWLLPLCVERQADWQSAFVIDSADRGKGGDPCTSSFLMIDYYNWGMNARARELAAEGLARDPNPRFRAYFERVNGLLDARARTRVGPLSGN